MSELVLCQNARRSQFPLAGGQPAGPDVPHVIG
jgi:hypothetical protein